MEKMRFDLDLSTIEFSFKNALLFAEASALAYDSEDVYIKKLKEKWGFLDVEPLNRGGTQGFVAKNSEIILIAFRGTEKSEEEDIVSDLLACQVDTKLGKVHYGFVRALKYVWKDLLKALEKLYDNNQKIFVTGHSLGGALATLAVAKLGVAKKDYNICGMYTFGQPRVGDLKFKTAFEKSFKEGIYRVTNYRDPVAIVPISINRKIFRWRWRVQYKHVGELKLLNESGKIVENKELKARRMLVVGVILAIGISWIIKLVRKVKSSEKILKWLSVLSKPHGLEGYIKNIQNNIFQKE